MINKLVAYHRVSTEKQGKSGLGIDAQREVIRRFAEAEGLSVVAEFVEVETGRAPMLSIVAPCSGRRWRQRARSRAPL